MPSPPLRCELSPRAHSLQIMTSTRHPTTVKTPIPSVTLPLPTSSILAPPPGPIIAPHNHLPNDRSQIQVFPPHLLPPFTHPLQGNGRLQRKQGTPQRRRRHNQCEEQDTEPRRIHDECFSKRYASANRTSRIGGRGQGQRQGRGESHGRGAFSCSGRSARVRDLSLNSRDLF